MPGAHVTFYMNTLYKYTILRCTVPPTTGGYFFMVIFPNKMQNVFLIVLQRERYIAAVVS